MIKNNWVHSNTEGGIKVEGGNTTIENNLVEYNGSLFKSHYGISAAGSDLLLANNIVRHNTGYGIYLALLKDSHIEKNVIYGHKYNSGIFATCPSGGGQNSFVNNTISENKTGLMLWNGVNEIVANNIFYSNTAHLAYTGGNTTTMATEANNISYFPTDSSYKNLLTKTQSDIEVPGHAGLDSVENHNDTTAQHYAGLRSFMSPSVPHGGSIISTFNTKSHASPEQTYIAQVRIKSTAVSGSVAVSMQFYNSSNAKIGNSYGSKTTSVSNSDWTLCESLSAIAPVNTAYIILGVDNQGADADTFYADNLMLEQSSTISTWQPGIPKDNQFFVENTKGIYWLQSGSLELDAIKSGYLPLTDFWGNSNFAVFG